MGRPSPTDNRVCRSMCSPFVPRQTSGEVRRRVKADRLTPASPTGFRPSVYVTNTPAPSRQGTSFVGTRRSYAPIHPTFTSEA